MAVERGTVGRRGGGVRLAAGLGAGCGGLGLAALAGAPWWVAVGGFAVAAIQVLAATALGIVRSIAPQTSRDRRAVLERLLDRGTRGTAKGPS